MKNTNIVKALVSVVALLAATTVASAQEVSIRLAAQSGGAQDAFAAVIEKFEAENPGVRVETEFHVVSDYPNIIKTQMRAGNGPDVFYGSSGTGYPNNLYQLGEAGFLVDMADRAWVGKLGLPEGAKPLFFWDGKLWAAPLNVVPLGSIYSVNTFKEHGLTVPKTFGELLEMCDKAREGGISLIAEAGVNAGSHFNQVASDAVFAHDPLWNVKRAKGEVTFAGSDLWKDAFARLSEMLDHGCYPDGVAGLPFAGNSPLVVGGQAAMRSSVAAVRSSILRLDPSVELGYFVFPGKTEDETRVTVATSDALGVNAASSPEKQAAALKFVDYLMEGEGAVMFPEIMGNISMAESASGKLPDIFSSAGDLFAKGAIVEVATLGWPNGEVYSNMLSGIQGIMAGVMTADEVLASMDEAWDR